MNPRPKLDKYIGQVFGKVTVVGINQTGRSKFVLVCECGKSFSTRYDYVIKGTTTSCGCSKKHNFTKYGTSFKGLPKYAAATNALYARYKRDAAQHNRVFSLTIKEFAKIIKADCTYCGCPPMQQIWSAKSTGVLLYNGIDRDDNSLGYTVDNSVPCCKRCNFFKNAQNGTDFLELVQKIYKNKRQVLNLTDRKLENLMERAEATAKNSPDAETKVGALLVSKKSGSILADAYNGFIRGAPDEIIPKTRPEKYEYVIHAETNLLCNAARNGVSTDDCVIVQTHSPCVHCARLLFQAGITVVYYKDYYRGTDEVKRLGDMQLKYTACGKYTKIEIEPTKKQE